MHPTEGTAASHSRARIPRHPRPRKRRKASFPPEAVPTSTSRSMPERGRGEAPALELAKELIARKSITPEDGGCQELLAARLSRAGFPCEPRKFGEVTNLWPRR